MYVEVVDQTWTLVGMVSQNYHSILYLWQVVISPINPSDLKITQPGVKICGSQAVPCLDSVYGRIQYYQDILKLMLISLGENI